jgi:hypothetical protein
VQTPLDTNQLRHQVLLPMHTLPQVDLCNTQGEAMNKEEALAAIKLLSAIESWGFSLKERMPDYLHEDLCRSMDVLERIVLEKP